ncbi:hemolysin family protein [Catellatospora tritici]|uniref:hemolysin family protein n=1 Tax=Catellatospora tritici TaxID=2851566 RepID=UPI001C2CD37B|nr:hemolysin family protein [Catellatospora tritici]
MSVPRQNTPALRESAGREPRRREPRLRPPGRVARALAPAIVRAADALTRWTNRVLGVEATVGREQITEAELRQLVAVNTALDPEERHIIGKALARSAANLREVMVPRTEVWFLDVAMTVAEAVAEAREAGHTRFPVTDGSHDDVVGFVHLRDLLWDERPERPVRELAREIKRLPGSKPVLAALSEMRRERNTIAVVVDEYGGTAGIVTLEDLIEELVGEIHDEYDETPVATSTGPRVPTEVDGMINLADFAERTGVRLPAGPYETVGGYLMSTLGRMPQPGDTAQLDSYQLTVLALEGRRVAQVRLELAEPVPEFDREPVEQPSHFRTGAPDGETGLVTEAA